MAPDRGELESFAVSAEVYADDTATQSAINSVAVGGRTAGLVKDGDGSSDILIQRDEPTGALAANWLPAAAGVMRMSLRAYLPRRELRDRSWKVPPVRKV